MRDAASGTGQSDTRTQCAPADRRALARAMVPSPRQLRVHN